MSAYLVNLARRSAGMAPVAHPRVGPPAGVSVRLGTSADAPGEPARPSRVATASTDGAAAGARAEEPVPRPARSASEGVELARVRVSEPRDDDEPTRLRVRPRASMSGAAEDHSTAVRAAAAPTTGTLGSASVPTHHAVADGGERTAISRNAKTIGGRATTDGIRDPRSSDAVPRALIEPAATPARLASPLGRIVPQGAARAVDVRIGTIEIHSEPAGPPPGPAQDAPAAAPARPVGGFDDFVRLRTYAPWER